MTPLGVELTVLNAASFAPSVGAYGSEFLIETFPEAVQLSKPDSKLPLANEDCWAASGERHPQMARKKAARAGRYRINAEGFMWGTFSVEVCDRMATHMVSLGKIFVPTWPEWSNKPFRRFQTIGDGVTPHGIRRGNGGFRSIISYFLQQSHKVG